MCSFCDREASVRHAAAGAGDETDAARSSSAQGRSAAAAGVDGAAPSDLLPPSAVGACWMPQVAFWRSSEAVRPARGAAFEPEARQLAIALSPRERKTTAKALGAAHYASKTVLCFVQTRRRTLLRPFWSVLTAKPAEPILPPPSKNGRRNGQRMRCQALWALRESSGPKMTAFEPGLRVARAQPSATPTQPPLANPSTPAAANKIHEHKRYET